MNPYSSESHTTRTVKPNNFDESTISWVATLFLSLSCIPMNVWGVWVQRRVAWETNEIELTQWWYLYALLGPVLVVVLAIVLTSSSRFWKSGICGVLQIV